MKWRNQMHEVTLSSVWCGSIRCNIYTKKREPHGLPLYINKVVEVQIPGLETTTNADELE